MGMGMPPPVEVDMAAARAGFVLLGKLAQPI